MTTKKSNTLKKLEAISGVSLSFASALNATRICQELSQVELAKLVGTTRSRICDFEKGRRLPSLALAVELARVLDDSETQFVRLVMEDQVKQAGLDMSIDIRVSATA